MLWDIDHTLIDSAGLEQRRLRADLPRRFQAAGDERAVAVASGAYPLAELRAAGPDIALESLADPRELRRLLDR